MELKRIRSLLAVGKHHCATLDAAPLVRFAGWLRVVTIREVTSGYLVEIAFLSAAEYEQYGLEEGPITYECAFTALESAVQCLEEYMGHHAQWNGGNSVRGPETGRDTGNTPGSALEQVLRAIASDTLELPRSGTFVLRNSAWIRKAIARLQST